MDGVAGREIASALDLHRPGTLRIASPLGQVDHVAPQSVITPPEKARFQRKLPCTRAGMYGIRGAWPSHMS